MTKAKSKGAKRRAKKAKLPPLTPDAFDAMVAPIERRLKRGKARMKELDARRDLTAQADQLKARARQVGCAPTEAALRDLKAPWWGCSAGRAMAGAVEPNERAELWDAIQHMRRVTLTYDRAIGAPHRHAVCMRLLAPSETFEADATTPPVDDRSDEERQEHAVAAYNTLMSWLCRVDRITSKRARDCVLDDAPAYDSTGLVATLRCVADGMKGR